LYRSLRVAKDDSSSSRFKLGQPDRGRRRRRIVRALIVVVSTVIVVDALVGERGLLAMLRARQEHDGLTTAIARQRMENDRLREEIRRLTEDPAAIEEIARRELGLIRPGEKVFILRDVAPPGSHPAR
jgi:cell division protein FtsB